MDTTCDNKNGYQHQINAIKTGVYTTTLYAMPKNKPVINENESVLD